MSPRMPEHLNCVSFLGSRDIDQTVRPRSSAQGKRGQAVAAQSDSFFFFGRKNGEGQVNSMIFFMWFFNGKDLSHYGQ